MANVKGRLNAPKSAPTKKGRRGKGKKSSTGTIDVSQPDVVMKRQSDMKLLTPEEKVQYILQNGHLMKDKFINKASGNNGKLNKDALAITKESLITKSGRIKKKRKDNLKLIDNILKSELMIDDNRKNKTNSAKNKTYSINDGVNNNDDGISDQNKTESCSSDSTSGTVLNKKKPKQNGKKYKQNKSKNNKKDKKSEEELAKRLAKMKQVTLSNGVVLTLTLFQCDYCQKTFSSKSSLRRHIYMHLDLKPYPCSHCSRKFRQRGNLLIHIKRQHPEPEVFVCNKCDKPFLLKENLTLHLASHVKNENFYKCVYCGRRFSHHLLLIQHEKQHLVTGRFQCSICNMNYDCRSRLALHVKSHLRIKEFVCQYCGKEFLRPNSIRRHVQISHGGFRIQCPICKKKLKGHLTEHMRTHEKKRPHECPDCGQRFTQSTQLNVHRRSHTGARPYPCRICGRPFSHSNALMLHIRRHTGEKPFSCAMCPLSFSQLPHMKAHMRNIHGKENPYRCEKCNQFFKLKVQLENHVKTCTVGDRELSFEEKIQASVQMEEVEVESVMSLSRMRFLLALLLTMIATKEKLKYLGFNKCLIDDLLVESLEAMGHTPCKDESQTPLKRLKTNIEILLNGTVPKDQMEKFRKENKTTEELLELLTDEKKNDQ